MDVVRPVHASRSSSLSSFRNLRFSVSRNGKREEGAGVLNADTPTHAAEPRRVLLLGATGAIGRATLQALIARGHDVVCYLRPRPDGAALVLDGAAVRTGAFTEAGAVARDAFRGKGFGAVISCMASRTGAPADAWAVDHDAHVAVLEAAKAAGVTQFVLLSAICVQKPRLAFQHAKLAFEDKLAASGLAYSIVRPTAYFKSLSGQIARVRAGKRFVMFGDGRGTACKPISDRDLAAFIVDCLDDPDKRNRILPIGGPGPAITPRDQGEELFRLTGRPPRFAHVPLGLLNAIVLLLDTMGRVIPKLKDKAALARIGRYYATESMLALDPATGRYSADTTPETGTDRLFDFYAQAVAGDASVDLGAHKVFS